jgi:hypothetical protein
MNAEELEARIEKLIAEARDAGMERGVIIDVLHDVAETLQEEEEGQS